jgi:hypothetical protein
VEFVEDIAFQRQPTPSGIFPAKAPVYDLRRPVDTFRLVSGGRIRSFLFIVQAVSVQRSGSDVFHNGVKIAVTDGLHDNFPLPWFANAYFNPAGPRSPDQKTAGVLA